MRYFSKKMFFLIVIISSEILFGQSRYNIEDVYCLPKNTPIEESLCYFKYDMTELDGMVYCEHGDIGLFKKGKKNGLYREYYKNGNLKYDGYFLNGYKVDNHKEWFEDGKLKSSGDYLDYCHIQSDSYYQNDYEEYGFYNGTFKRWNELGTLVFQGTYKKCFKNGWFVEPLLSRYTTSCCYRYGKLWSNHNEEDCE